jgi:L-ascorbate metabolism protein UlaG (beta-lactamase superfamily)
MGPGDLPPLDAVLLSHLHGDHFDRIARRALARDLPVVTTAPAARRLRRWGFEAATPLRTWDSHRFDRAGQRLQITAVPAVHGPGLLGAALPETMGSIVELERDGRPVLRLYVTGDTLFRPRRLQEIRERFPHLDVMVVHLGGTRILGMLVTLDHRQGADLVHLVAPRLTIPVHTDDYGVFHSRPQDFHAEVRRRGLPYRVRPIRRGECVHLPSGTSAGTVN